MRKTGLAFFLLVAALLPSSSAWGSQPYPNRGSFYYNGDRAFDIWMMWEAPGGFFSHDPVYEQGFAINRNYYDSCTSFTNLPFAYDDCETAGVSEQDPNMYVFGWGSYHLIVDQCCNTYSRHSGYHPPLSDDPIYPNGWYYAALDLFCEENCPSYNSAYNLGWQEVDRIFCSSDYPWCMYGLQGSSLVEGHLYYGTPLEVHYLYDPNTGQRIY